MNRRTVLEALGLGALVIASPKIISFFNDDGKIKTVVDATEETDIANDSLGIDVTACYRNLIERINYVSTAQQEAKSNDIALFADLHFYFPSFYRSCRPNSGGVMLEQFIDDLNRRGIKHLINLGDLICQGSQGDISYARNAEILGSILRSFNGEIHHVIGNHDIAKLNTEEFITKIGGDYSQYSPERGYSYGFDVNDRHFVVLDPYFDMSNPERCRGTNWRYRSGSWFAPAQLEWLEDELRDNPKSIVLMHENLYDEFICNAWAVREIMERNGVLQVFNGHWHSGTKASVNGINYLGVPSFIQHGSAHYILHSSQIISK